MSLGKPTRRTVAALLAGGWTVGANAVQARSLASGAGPVRKASMDTIAERWAKLQPHVTAYGPADDARRPALLMFHGCGGQRTLARHYGEAAAAVGWRAFAVDSFGPRGWNRAFALTFVCTGMLLKGAERAGDVLATAWGVSQRPDVDADSLVLGGWSHGAWAIMDMMTMPLARPGEAGVADPSPELVAGVKGLFLAYPYGGIGALSRFKPWVRKAPVSAMACEKDHITSLKDAERLYAPARRAGCEVDLWKVPASHAFDEEDCNLPMRYDAELSGLAHRRLQAFLKSVAEPAQFAPEALSA